MAMADSSKQQKAFYRKLYLAHLISSGNHNVPSLEAETGMPRRTIQDCLKTLIDLDIICEFSEPPGERHNHGRLTIISWGAIDPHWVKDNATRMAKTLAVDSA